MKLYFDNLVMQRRSPSIPVPPNNSGWLSTLRMFANW